MKTMPAGLTAMLATGTTTLCRCWRVERVDGLVFGFTDHDLVLSFGGTDYEPDSGFTSSSIEASLGLAVDTMEVGGALSSAAITEDDIALGRWDAAGVEIWAVDWSDVANRVILRRGSFGEIVRGELAFEAELRGLAHHLNQEIGRSYDRNCDAVVGDARCGVDLGNPAFAGSGAVTSAGDDQAIVVSGLGSFASGWFTQGVLTWTSGANQGVAAELRAHAGTSLMLWQRAAMPVEPGDSFTVTAGCPKTFDACQAKFANAVNFRGFPHIPGNDFALGVVKSDSQNDGGSFFR